MRVEASTGSIRGGHDPRRIELRPGRRARGIEILQKAVRLRPREFRVWLAMGKVLHDLGDFPKAIQAYEKALGLKPDDREALVGLIRCLMSSDLPDQAEARVTRALEKYPDDSTVLGFAARVRFTRIVWTRRSHSPIALWRAIPRIWTALLTRARAHVVRSQWEKALPDAERAVAALPQQPGLAPVAPEDSNQAGPDRASQLDASPAGGGLRIASQP